ncbi:MAG: hypothetical protein IJZ16_00690 [Clostridia bacterium]|nr:hypothetical protein [Clostridia bacterium]
MSKICPKCNKVYEDNTTACPECSIELIDAPAEAPVEVQEEVKQVSVFSLTSEDSAQRVIEYMKEQGVEGEYRYSLREKTFKIFVAQPDARNALRACTAFYAVEAKRLKAEEDKRREEEEARRRAEEEERRRIEEEERLRREAEEAARREAEEAAIRAAEEEARIKAEEAERIRREAEEAVRRAEEEARRLEEEAARAAAEEERRRIEAEEAEKRRAAEEARRAAEEEMKRLEAEAEQKRLESERRRNLFAASIREAEEAKLEEQKKKLNFIPHVEGETVQEEVTSSPVIEEFEPEMGPIFVETEPVDEYEVGDTITVDAIEVETTDEEPEEVPQINEEEEVSFENFLASLKKNKNGASVFGDSEDDEEEAPLFSSSTVKPQKPLVEDMFTDNVFANLEKSASMIRPSEEKKDVIEEVINDNLKSSSSSTTTSFKSRFASKFAGIDDIDDGTYKGFVPDYHQDETEDQDTLIAKSYGFDPEEYKKLKEETEKKARDRKNNPPPKPKSDNKDFQIVDDFDIGDYKGFVPDYSSKRDEEKMQYYTKRTTIDYSKYRTSSDNSDRNSLTDLSATLRSSSQTELSRLFENDVLKTAAKPQDYIALRSSTYLLALTGGQLNSLFTSWLMTNCTSATVRQYAKEGASSDENYNNKIEGIKNLMKQNFGKLDDDILDIIVKKFYNKYLDD